MTTKIYHVTMPDDQKYWLYEYSKKRVWKYNPRAKKIECVDYSQECTELPHLSLYYAGVQS